MSTWTAYSSLLGTLDLPQQQNAVEVAAEARQCGRYIEAEEIFASRLPPAESLPLLAFEYADLLTDQGLEGDRVYFLKKAIAHMQLDGKSDEQMLLNLMLADAQLWAFGSLDNAVKAARENRSWLNTRSVDKLSDLHIRGIQLYYQVMKCGFKDSKWVKRTELTVYGRYKGDLAAECNAISQSLRAEGRLAHAARIMLQQLHETSISSLAELCLEVSTYCSELESDGARALSFRSAYTRISIADYARQTSLVELAKQCRSAAVLQLQKLVDASGTDWHAFSPKLSARIDMDALSDCDTSPALMAEKLESLADRFIHGKDYTTANLALNMAITAAKRVANDSSDKKSGIQLRDILMKLHSLHQGTTRSCYFEAVALLELLLLADLKMKANDDILKEVSVFEDSAPLFDVPLLRERLYRVAMTAAQDTDRKSLLDKYDTAQAEVLRDCPMERVPIENTQVILSIQKNFKNALDMGRNAVEIALLWGQEEYESEVLSQQQWEDIFGWYELEHPEKQQSSAFPRFLDRVRRERRRFSDSFFAASREHWTMRFNKLREWLLEDQDRIPKKSRSTILLTIAEAWGFKQRSDWVKQATRTDEEASLLTQYFTADIALANEMRAIDQAQLSSMVGLPAALAKKDENVFRVISLIKAPTPNGQPDAFASGELSNEALDQAIQDSEDVFAEYQNRQNYLGMFTTLRRQAEFVWNKFMYFKTAHPDDALAVLSRAEEVYDEVRRNQSVPSHHHYSIASKVQQLRKYDAGDLYDKGICWNRFAWNLHNASFQRAKKDAVASEDGVAVEAQQTLLKQLDREFVESYARFVGWTQKSKSRALSDIIGLESPIPSESLEKCNRDPYAADMIQRERELNQKLAWSTFPQVLHIREMLDTLRKEMRQHPLLSSIMSIRDGDTIGLSSIQHMLQELPDSVIFVDFIYVHFDKPLRALCYRKGVSYPPVLIFDVSMEALETWTKQLDKAAHGPLGCADSGRASLAELTPILLPLFKVMKGSLNPQNRPVIMPGDTIIFCPTGVLHKIPFHAIPIDGVPIIEKHPVVSCPSLTVLRHCLQMVKEVNGTKGNTLSKRLVLNPMPSHWKDKDKITPVESTPAVKGLAGNLGAAYLHGWNLSKGPIIDSLNGLTNFHYHGHVGFQKTSGMESYLLLGDLSNNNNDDNDLPNSERRLTANDLLGCKLAKPALATIVGCQSGVADISAADDALGIPMALHYAGAAATVSSLWKLDDMDGVVWEGAFYDDLLKQAKLGNDADDSDKKITGEENNTEGMISAKKEDIEEGHDVTGKRSKIGQEYSGEEGDVVEHSVKKHKLVNLAVAMQKAVHCLRFANGEERAPYHWAGYVLAGSWMFPFEESVEPYEMTYNAVETPSSFQQTEYKAA